MIRFILILLFFVSQLSTKPSQNTPDNLEVVGRRNGKTIYYSSISNKCYTTYIIYYKDSKGTYNVKSSGFNKAQCPKSMKLNKYE